MGAATALVMIAADTPAAGSIALGASLAGVGILFAGVAAVAVQVSQSTGGAYGLVGAVLGASFALRAAGDVGDGTLSWLSPIGWGQAMRPYADERWWPLLLLLVFTVLLLRGRLRAARAPRRRRRAARAAPGPAARGARARRGRSGLAFRLQRGALIGWAVGLFFGGLSIGLTAQDADSILGDSKEVDELFAQAAGQPGRQLPRRLAALDGADRHRLRARGRAADARARRPPGGSSRCSPPRSRGRAGRAGYVAVAAGGTVVVLAASGLGAGIADAANSDDLGRLPLLVGSSVALAPAVWVLIGLAVALFGLLPRAVAAVWGALAACYLAAFLGPLLGLPDWVMDLSPFTHVPLLPAAGFDVVPLLVLTAVAAALCARRAGGLPPAERSRVANVNCGWVGSEGAGRAGGPRRFTA